MYQDILLDHYRRPRNVQEIAAPHFSKRIDNALCGDSVVVSGCISDGVLSKLSCRARGCVISVATASLLTDVFLGKNIDFIVRYDTEAVLSLIHMQLGPTRLRCALLGLEAIQRGVIECEIVPVP